MTFNLRLLFGLALAGCATPATPAVPQARPQLTLVPATPATPAPALAAPAASAGALPPRLELEPAPEVETQRYATLTPTGLGVAVVDARTGQALAIGQPPPWHGTVLPHLSADGSLLVYDGGTNLTSRLVAWDVNAGAALGLPGLPADTPHQPNVDATGRRLVYVAGNALNPAIAIFDRLSGTETTLPLAKSLLNGAGAPAISGDGLRVAYVMTPQLGQAQLVVVDVTTGRPITPPTLASITAPQGPALSPDGATLVFGDVRTGETDLVACDLATGELRDLSCCNANDQQNWPSFVGLAGSLLAYVSTVGAAARMGTLPFAPWRSAT